MSKKIIRYGHRKWGKVICKTSEIKDETLLEKLKPLLTGEVIHSLEAIKLVQEFYGRKYPDMTYKDWSEMVRNMKF